MNEWNIQGRAHACQTCGNPFADRQPYHTLLFDDRSDYRRLDVCPACWETRHRDNDVIAKGFISHWQGIYEAPPPPTDPIQKDTAESLLRKLIERNDPRYAPAGFILAVMLERKRVLKVKEQLQREGQRVFVYEQPKTGDVFTIADPNLRLDQLDEVQRDVAMLLEHGLPEQEAAPPAATPTENLPPAAATPSDLSDASDQSNRSDVSPPAAPQAD
ncbi:MAG TPA: hypothetical protein VI136_12755 [Verrucomicrobiae bacterium]